MAFKRASKKSARLRLALIGPAGSGKTYSALALATRLVPGGRVAVIDTERGSASKYARPEGGTDASHPDTFAFDVLELQRFEPSTYIEAMREAERGGYDALVIDSLSHAWVGSGGILDQLDRKAGQSANSFNAWRTLTPQHNELVDALLNCKCHLLVTMRTKTEYVVEKDDRGKSAPRKIGLAPVQRDGLEYEFDVVMDVDDDHVAKVTKTRCSALADRAFRRPGAEVADTLRAWLSDGAAPESPPSEPDRLGAAPTQHVAGGSTAEQPAPPAAEQPRPVDWLARIVLATKHAKPGASLITAGGELGDAELNGTRDATLAFYAAAVTKLLAGFDAPTCESFGKLWRERVPEAVRVAVAGHLAADARPELRAALAMPAPPAAAPERLVGEEG